jgi:DNA polymerase-1
VAEEGFLLLAADYVQIELRILASMSQDPGLIAAFAEGLDIHNAAAVRIFNVEPDAVTRDMRRKAKEVNYGIPYGISVYELGQRLRVEYEEAKSLMDEYHKSYPEVSRLNNQLIEQAREHGYVETLLGRRRYIPTIRSSSHQDRAAAERMAVNMPIQGTQADMIKLAMVRIHRRLQSKHFKTRMILQVHDELVFETPPDELDMVKELIRSEMVNALPLEVPIEVDIGVGENWLDAH